MAFFFAKHLALNSRKLHQKNLIGENGGQRKLDPSTNPGICYAFFIGSIMRNISIKLFKIGPVVLKIFLFLALVPFCLAEQNYLCNFGRSLRGTFR